LKGINKRQLGRDEKPKTLRVHLRILMNRKMFELEARSFIKVLDGHVRSSIAQRYGIEAPKRVLDPATATYNQPIYVRANYVDGCSDPFGNGQNRSGILGHGLLDVDVVLSECLEAPKDKKNKKKDEQSKTIEIEELSERKIRAMLREMRKSGELSDRGFNAEQERPSGRAARYAEFASIAILDAENIINDRIGMGGLWNDGIPEGGRNKTLLMLATLAFYAGYSRKDAVDYVAMRFRVSNSTPEFLNDWKARALDTLRSQHEPARPSKDGLCDALEISTADYNSVQVLVREKHRNALKRAALRAAGLTARGTERKGRSEKTEVTPMRSLPVYFSAAKSQGWNIEYTETVEQEAKRTGVSVRTIQRRRRAEESRKINEEALPF
jgi:hypothetical protein